VVDDALDGLDGLVAGADAPAEVQPAADTERDP
jgi:hypothetical protein